ncbi:MAG: MFS transporter [Piscinibacter sp.]|uniref:MFS transporter n=1 Tax=Piscinibacter sp. TaxID=1903157 RepID=UPI00258E3150|nr:MFS transporter [Piscinibacter sp.]MCW5667965.1 MFS transporter [Piscinibacter sp.]
MDSCLTVPPPPAPGLFSRGLVAASLGAVALVSLIAFEAMALAAAMPAIAAALDGLGLYALAFGGMVATSVIGMVAAGRWCDRHGARRATALGLVVFGAGLLIAGAASGMGWVVAGRVVQGFGAGMLGVALYVGMGQLVPAALHPRLFALLAAAWVVPGLVGPPLAAGLVHWLGWRSVFFVAAALVPLTALLLLPSFGRLPRPARAAAPQVDQRLAWAALAALGALLLHAAGQALPAAWRGPALLAGLGAAGLAAARLLPRGSLAAAPGLPAVVALRGLLASAFGCAEVFLPLALTRAAGWSLAQAGIALSTGAVMWSLGSAVQARLQDAQHRRRGLQAGLAGVAAGLAIVAAPLAAGTSSTIATFTGWALAGFGIGLGFPMLSVLTLALSRPEEQGRHASALQLADALTTSAALALAGGLFTLGGLDGPRAFALVLALPIGLALLGAGLARRAFG